MNLLLIALGGAIGTVLRHLSSVFINKLSLSNFPIAVISVNVLGSALMGALTGLAISKIQLSPELKSFLMIGLLGGFTTFSSFSLEAVNLLEKNEYLNLTIYILASVVLSIAGFITGYKLAA